MPDHIYLEASYSDERYPVVWKVSFRNKSIYYTAECNRMNTIVCSRHWGSWHIMGFIISFSDLVQILCQPPCSLIVFSLIAFQKYYCRNHKLRIGAIIYPCSPMCLWDTLSIKLQMFPNWISVGNGLSLTTISTINLSYDCTIPGVYRRNVPFSSFTLLKITSACLQ